MSIFSKLCMYGSSLILGLILFIVARPYAMMHRSDPSLFGGEVLLIFAPFVIILLINTIRKGV